jgi:hypothetical protein
MLNTQVVKTYMNSSYEDMQVSDECFGVQKFPKKSKKSQEWNPEPKDKKRIKGKDFTFQRKAKRQELE